VHPVSEGESQKPLKKLNRHMSHVDLQPDGEAVVVSREQPESLLDVLAARKPKPSHQPTAMLT